MAPAAPHPKIVKKKTTKFKRWQSDMVIGVKPSWRKPKGIDSRIRRRFKGTSAMPKIGYGSNTKTKYLMPSGHKAFLVHNLGDIEVLLLHSKTYAAEIAHNVSSRKRIAILEKAKQYGIKVTNPTAKLRLEG
ncbi:60S ribosomal protein eL32 [Lipomyces oligophaga]|uniref:60S ribosomal protein eL32 n=1 Tax=Lipomyces oligophaga TaxID=45792 RepID=UPI0034CFD76D